MSLQFPRDQNYFGDWKGPTLRGPSRSWYRRLELGSIANLKCPLRNSNRFRREASGEAPESLCLLSPRAHTDTRGPNTSSALPSTPITTALPLALCPYAITSVIEGAWW